jgi:hypothetical protein
MRGGRAMYIWHLKNVVGAGSADDVIAKAVRAKLSSLWVKIGDGSRAFDNTKGAVGKLLQDLIAKSAASGIDVLGYHVPWCATQQSTGDEIDFLARTVGSFNLAGIVVDNEDGSSYFKGTAETAAQYASGLSQAMKKAGKQVLMSSHDIVSSHPKAFAEIIGKSIDINAPQVYYGQSPSVSSRLNWAVRENKGINAPLFPVGAAFLRNANENDGGFLDAKKCAAWAGEFIGLVSLLHHSSPEKYPGYGFWNWEEAPDEVWQVLYDSDVFLHPTDQPNLASLTLAPRPDVGTAALAAFDANAGAGAAPKGWTLAVQRIRSEERAGEGFARTVGTYSVLHDGVPRNALSGMTVERQGPGDNGSIGKAQHRCIAAGDYPLRPHASQKYRTTGYASDGSHPRPAIELGDTRDRSAILVHPADRYGSTIGCINLSGPLTDAESDIVLPDSIKRVIAVIEDLRAYCGGRLNLAEDGSIQGAKIVIADNAAGIPAAFAVEASAAVSTAEPDQDCLIYEQATGRMLIKENAKYDTLAVGYSGSLSKNGKNDPSKQCEKGVGPIPRGRYTIGAPEPGPSPYSLRLTPDPSNDMCGRSGFLIHGDSIAHPGDASDGCIILSRAEREAIVKTGLRLLFVTGVISH